MIEFTTEPKKDESLLPILPDIKDIEPRFEAYKEAVNEMAETAKALVVQDDESKVKATEIGSGAHGLVKKLKARRDEIIEAPDAFVRGVKNLVKPFLDSLEDTKKISARKISDFEAAEELKRREEEERQRREREELQKALDKEAEEKGLEKVTLPDVVEPEPEKVTRSSAGSAHAAKRWTFEVEDLSKVPRKYLMLDERIVNGAIKAGVRKIAGLRIYQARDTKFRT